MNSVSVLSEKILSSLQNSSSFSAAQFNALALEVFEYQFSHVQMYRKFCEPKNALPFQIQNYKEIPPLFTSAFRKDRLASFPPHETKFKFETSGTTQEKTGSHELRSLHLYEASCREGFRPWLPPSPNPPSCLSLIPSFLEKPSSSLACMVDILSKEFSNQEVFHAFQNGKIDFEKTNQFVREIEKKQTPLWIATTTIALFEWLTFLKNQKLFFHLHPSSFLFHTGGRKGLRSLPDPLEMASWGEEHLGISIQNQLGEYGMTEISSPSWGRLVQNQMVFQSPPWSPVRILNLKTEEEVDVGEEGAICLFDLCNLESVSGLCTGDWGRRQKNGFEVLGRISDSEVRGCSHLVPISFLSFPKTSLSTFLKNEKAKVTSSPKVSFEQTVSSLDKLSQKWRDPNFPTRKNFETSLSSFFSKGSITQGLNQTFENLLEVHLRKTSQKSWPNERPSNPSKLSTHIWAGNLPVTGVFGFYASLLSGSPSLHRISLRGGTLLQHLHQTLKEIDPALASLVSVVQTNSSDERETKELLQDSTIVVAQGSDSTLQRLRDLCPPQVRFYSYGTQFSFAFMDLDSERNPSEFKNLYRDILIWEQKGCLSPQALFIHQKNILSIDPYLQDWLALGKKEALEWERKASLRNSSVILSHKQEQEWNSNQKGKVFLSDHLSFFVRSNLEPSFFSTPGFIQIIPISNEDELKNQLQKFENQISSFAVPSNQINHPWVQEILEKTSIERLTEFGNLQSPELGWAQNGWDRLNLYFNPKN